MCKHVAKFLLHVRLLFKRVTRLKLMIDRRRRLLIELICRAASCFWEIWLKVFLSACLSLSLSLSVSLSISLFLSLPTCVCLSVVCWHRSFCHVWIRDLDLVRDCRRQSISRCHDDRLSCTSEDPSFFIRLVLSIAEIRDVDLDLQSHPTLPCLLTTLCGFFSLGYYAGHVKLWRRDVT